MSKTAADPDAFSVEGVEEVEARLTLAGNGVKPGGEQWNLGKEINLSPCSGSSKDWECGHRHGPCTQASYRKNTREGMDAGKWGRGHHCRRCQCT